ncbi:hypothetical protein IKF03_00355 [Candidatus Saccharibacteria bacterium]|nr:hypothetical protein [Candidatus Saccharibacteria bacterium]
MGRKRNNNGTYVGQIVEKIVTDKKIRLFVDQNKDPYIAPNGDGTKVYELDSQDATDWLLGYVMDNFNNTVLIRDEPKNIIDSLRGYAKVRGLGNVCLELRTAKDDDGNIWYDLGSGAIKITPKGWTIVHQPPILFMRNYSQQEQVFPEKGGSIWELFEYINVKNDQDKLLLIAFLVASLIPGTNKPILAISGPAGSGKSECTKTLKMLMDPTTPPSMPPIISVDELNKLALTSSVMSFDNLSSMKNSVADQFCRLATGTGVRIRKLYKTNEYIVFEAIRPIIVNGISQIITQSDLLNRAIPIELSPIEKRITDDELREKFSRARPRLLGAMFDLLSKAIAIYPTITRTEWPRMGAFARWGYAVCEALEAEAKKLPEQNGDSSMMRKIVDGEAFMNAYSKVEKIQHTEALYANPLAEVVEWIMQNRDVWGGTAGDLLDLALKAAESTSAPRGFKHLCRSPYWPSNPRSTSVCLRKNIADFKAMGLIVIPPKQTERNFFIVNTQLPCCRACKEVLDMRTPDGPTFREMGYTVRNLAEASIYTINHMIVDFDESDEPHLRTFDEGALVALGMKEGLSVPKDLATNIAKETHEWLHSTYTYGMLPDTEARFEIRKKREEREQRKREIAEIKAREEAESLRRREIAERNEKKRKKAAYIAECEEKGVPVDPSTLGMFDLPF